MKKLLTFLCITLLLVACTPNKQKPGIINMKLSEAMTKIENQESGIFYFGYPGCPWCQEAHPIIDELSEENKMTVYYINTEESKKEETFQTDFQKLVEYTYDYLDVDQNGEKKFFVPHIFFIKDGKIVANHLGTVSGHDPYVSEMTDMQIQELKNIYQAGFDKMK